MGSKSTPSTAVLTSIDDVVEHYGGTASFCRVWAEKGWDWKQTRVSNWRVANHIPEKYAQAIYIDLRERKVNIRAAVLGLEAKYDQMEFAEEAAA